MLPAIFGYFPVIDKIIDNNGVINDYTVVDIQILLNWFGLYRALGGGYFLFINTLSRST